MVGDRRGTNCMTALVFDWDALTVVAAQTCECRALLTEDLQHGRSFGRVQVINPFESPDWTPAQVLQSLES